MINKTLKPLALLPLIATLTACQVPVVLQGDQSLYPGEFRRNQRNDLEMSQADHWLLSKTC